MDDADGRDDEVDRNADRGRGDDGDADAGRDPTDDADAGRDPTDDAEWGAETEWGVESNDATVASDATTDRDATGDGTADRDVGPMAHLRLLTVGLGLVVLAFVVGIVAGNLISLALVVAGVDLTDTVLLFVSLIGIQGIGFPVVGLGYLAYIDRDLREFIPIRWPSLKEIGISIGTAISALVLVAIVATVLLSLVETEPARNTGGETVAENPGIVPYLIPFVFLLNGPGEELLFRGVLQGRFREVYGPTVAIVLASLMFAPAHIVSLSGSLQAAALTISILTVPSLLFGAVYEYTDNFVVPALVHSIYNSILFGSVYLASRYGPDEAAQLLVF